ncbi:MAG: hypothetical protein HUJ26_22855 [Planctomycetaceae bacterium]|nr:hypothetical protein [Planctomycetaceae bacterium]
MKRLSIIALTVVSLFVPSTAGYCGPPASEATETAASFLQPGEWWNLYCDEANDPLKRAVRAVKIVQVSERHASWVQITFPADRDEHFSIFGPAAKAHKDRDVDLETTLAQWEQGIDEWKTMWINLDYVVRATRVEQQSEKKPQEASLR